MRLLPLLALLLPAACVLDDPDADGFVGEEDCDNFDPASYPGAEEVCDGVDNDCNGVVDDGVRVTFYLDADADGYGTDTETVEACAPPVGYAREPGDCNDAVAAISPVAAEQCDGVDNNCDGELDEGAAVRFTFYADTDRDGFGDPNQPVLACAQPENAVVDASDCDDGDGEVYPGAPEQCDTFDNDCDGDVDEPSEAAPEWFVDVDGDGFGDARFAIRACNAPQGTVGEGTDCDDTDATAYPGATETCDGVDNDCDDSVDEAGAIGSRTFFEDLDGDGFGTDAATSTGCVVPDGFAEVADDCDDSLDATFPGAYEPCGVEADLDCDGAVARACTSCLDHLERGQAQGDGLYAIDPDGFGPAADVEVYCDMSTQGGGWTLVQRTVWAWQGESEQLLTGYAGWFDQTLGDPSPGSAYRMAGRHWPGLQETAEHLFTLAARTTEGGACAPQRYVGTGGLIDARHDTATITSATVTSGITPILGNLSTLDSGPNALCSSLRRGVPWFYGNCCRTCPTFGGTMWTGDPRPSSRELVSPDLGGQTLGAACAGSTPQAADLAPVYVGLDSFEYYLR